MSVLESGQAGRDARGGETVAARLRATAPTLVDRPIPAPLSTLHAPRSPRRGHTLAELMVVLTILVLFTGIVIPSLARAYTHTRTESAVQAVLTDLHYARARAVATGLRHEFTLDPDTLEIAVGVFHPDEMDPTVTGGAGGQAPLSDVTLRDRLPDGLRIIEWSVSPMEAGPALGTSRPGTQAEATSLVFYPEGTCDSALLVFEDIGGERRGVRVDPSTGVIRELTREELQGQ
jgi:type II secretory pathway pseudopilin PulG